MRELIFDLYGIQFTKALCDGFASQERIDFALQSARIAMQITNQVHREFNSEFGKNSNVNQWCLPMLLSEDPSQPIIDWDFQTDFTQSDDSNKKNIDNISLPIRFIGRRTELRKYKNQLNTGNLEKFMITGPGGQGKTALAGKLALDLINHGYQVFAWFANTESSWKKFQSEIEFSLDGSLANEYDRKRPLFENEASRIEFLLDSLVKQYQRKLVIFIDNLETMQDMDTQELKDPQIAAWITTAQSIPGLVLIITSRFQFPEWTGSHLPLFRTNYGDFLQLLKQLVDKNKFPIDFLEKRENLPTLYNNLGGNARSLEFFASAMQSNKGNINEEVLQELLAQTKSETQINMAIAEIYKHLPTAAKTLLARLPAFQQPVPIEGIVKLGLDINQSPEAILKHLVAVSLVESQYVPDWDVIQYQCVPLVTDWLQLNNQVENNPKLADICSDYQVYLFQNERQTLNQAMISYYSLLFASKRDQANKFALRYIVN